MQQARCLVLPLSVTVEETAALPKRPWQMLRIERVHGSTQRRSKLASTSANEQIDLTRCFREYSLIRVTSTPVLTRFPT